MRHSEIMLMAWQRADDFNVNYPVGSKVTHGDKQAIVSDHAYVLPAGQIVVLLNDNQTPINIDNLTLC